MPGTSTRAELTVLPPLSLYIHLPWCVKKCPYCDFNSHALREGIPERRYIDALIADLDHELPNVWGRRVTTVFFGGGTPSLFSASAIDEILAAVRARIALDPGAEITLEANPGTVEAEKFEGFARAGVNRLSLGIQSFDNAHLRALGRIHDADEARRAITIAQDHFENVNLDLMFALPRQSMQECAKDMERALGFGTTHLSLYHLTLEPNTLFHRDPPPLPDEDLAADMHAMVIETLGAAGYENYETSAHARAGRACRHNLNYWSFGDYLGIGAGAHGKVSFADRIIRTVKHKHPETYMRHALTGEAAQETREVTAAELPFEFMLNALRLSSGFPLALFLERTGLGLGSILPALNVAESRGLIERDHRQARPTVKGRMFLNDLLELFLLEDR
ncbi:MAG: oxygen-independent coproporphyrinogen III oxidase-like protein [Betaproteobacteria bacterium]|nr:oxygen-independent coproporphyrinogen III oxidase-like protein [Betaproteobacteria bacterium]